MNKTTKPFVPPTLQEIQDYIHENNYTVDATAFLWYYSKLGWRNANGKPVKNWKQTLIQVWLKRTEKTEPSTQKVKLYPIKGKTCSKAGCRMPAVYHDTSGNYDNYACSEHMPQEVKVKYD